MSDLLKDAIADAKAVRETAIENAKMALEEAFTPKLQSMLSAKIEEEMEDDADLPAGVSPDEDLEEQSNLSEDDADESEVYEDEDDGEDEDLGIDELTEDEDESIQDEDESMEEDDEEDLELESIIKELLKNPLSLTWI